MKITLCGSTRFMNEFGEWNIILSKAGHVVYTVAQSSHGTEPTTDEVKRRYDLVHLKKISDSDAIVVLNVGGYYGDSTRREIEWARMERKEVYWLENVIPGEAILGPSVWAIYNLFENGGAPLTTIAGTEKYNKEALPTRRYDPTWPQPPEGTIFLADD